MIVYSYSWVNVMKMKSLKTFIFGVFSNLKQNDIHLTL